MIAAATPRQNDLRLVSPNDQARAACVRATNPARLPCLRIIARAISRWDSAIFASPNSD